MCGEKRRKVCSRLCNVGSPPHVRGKAEVDITEWPQNRITPACAGKRRCKAAFCVWSWDHPRMCGEKTLYSGMHRVVLGSPPHVRGKGAVDFDLRHCIGITPACAGKRKELQEAVTGGKDHPRMCGEKLAARASGKPMEGSPPHVRGKGSALRMPHSFSGITPACAGKSTLERAIAHNEWDHPRMCGEKHTGKRSCGTCLGSPPHVRGKVRHRVTQ